MRACAKRYSPRRAGRFDQSRARRLGQQLRQRWFTRLHEHGEQFVRELAACDRGQRQHLVALPGEQVEAASQDRAQTRRHAQGAGISLRRIVERALLRHERDDLAHEERVSVGRPPDRVEHVRGQRHVRRRPHVLGDLALSEPVEVEGLDAHGVIAALFQRRQRLLQRAAAADLRVPVGADDQQPRGRDLGGEAPQQMQR